MREIKVRAWDKESKKMREIDSIAFHGKGAFDQSTQKIKLINLWGYNVIEEKDVIVQREPKDVVLLEFTGLKDKNGKEIYEGDIIEFNNCDYQRTAGNLDDEIVLGEVEYSCGAWGLKESNGQLHDLYLTLINDEEAEIIGNIYEHPHLLKG
ncbi:YopX family protein [Oceanobacillus kimchii]|uniref:YopX family protein n=1 Tax=Oceanobacillus kimchii TaxID=746691 RepID=UPI0021A2C4FB|nr:YopX family protein [Oceanobacillus kimchii]MCT1575675.1 YopX family protein [Oceanobacillus kimchii]MCT2137306.1 YopX family protein [Oceanobacillus kimchii]